MILNGSTEILGYSNLANQFGTFDELSRSQTKGFVNGRLKMVT